jgi:hypothetical protein
LTWSGAKSARNVGSGMRRYGDGLFGVGLAELDRRMKVDVILRHGTYVI